MRFGEIVAAMTDFARNRLGDIERQPSELHAGIKPSPMLRVTAAFDPFDVASAVLLAVLGSLVLATFRDYAITNDEWIQHRYGELIIAYYKKWLHRPGRILPGKSLPLWRALRYYCRTAQSRGAPGRV